MLVKGALKRVKRTSMDLKRAGMHRMLYFHVVTQIRDYHERGA